MNKGTQGVTEQADWSRLAAQPRVSVLMVAYHHAAYLAEAIEGVVAQKCPFPFELIIGEDASTDATLQIAVEYQARHPELIRVVHGGGNVGAAANFSRILALARGEFIAPCDGDDYWCSDSKLARQVALMDASVGTAIVHTDWVRSRRGEQGWEIDPWSTHRRVPRRQLEGDLFAVFYSPRILRACTNMFRLDAVRECLDSAIAQKRYRFDDTLWAAYMTSKWKVAYLDEVTAVYRESPGSALRSGRESKIRFLKSALEFDAEARQFFGPRADYPTQYRWELLVGLLLKAWQTRDAQLARFVWADARAYFGLLGFVKAGARALRVRWPSSSRS